MLPKRKISGRTPFFQRLESRCLLAFGDVDISFASNGRFEQSYEVENQTEVVRAIYDLDEDNQLIVESIAGGRGEGIGFRKVDENGAPITSFGDAIIRSRFCFD
ncbi:MAG: hypothetical protein AB8B50_07340 [Pirellulaceae bacterium]